MEFEQLESTIIEQGALRSIVKLVIYPADLREVEESLNERYPGFSHLSRPVAKHLQEQLTLNIALDPPTGEWNEEDEEFFDNNNWLLGWEPVNAQEWLKSQRLA